jgi:HEAT repeat protein
LLGQVKAVEALDVLIACINCNDGMHGLSAYRFPAFRALIMIGPEAVPKLVKALSDSAASTRGRAASALGEIGGADAKKALEQALISERDEDVVRSIKIALRKQ